MSAAAATGARVAELLAELELVAGLTGDAALCRAARAVRQSSPGRPAINDAAALDEIETLLAAGRPFSVVLRRVARAVGGYTSERSTVERLRRKFSARKNSSAK